MAAFDRDERLARAGCGLALGLLLGFVVCVSLFPESRVTWAIIIVIAAVTCAALGVHFGDEFWRAVSRILHWW